MLMYHLDSYVQGIQCTQRNMYHLCNITKNPGVAYFMKEIRRSRVLSKPSVCRRHT